MLEEGLINSGGISIDVFRLLSIKMKNVVVVLLFAVEEVFTLTSTLLLSVVCLSVLLLKTIVEVGNILPLGNI